LSYTRNTLARHKGRIAIVTNRGLGCDGRDGGGREWSLQGGFGREQWSSRARHDADSVFAWLRAWAHASSRSSSEDVRGRRSRVVLTPGVCASSLAVMWRPDRARASAIRERDGGNSASLPEESTKDTVKTIAQGRPGDPARPVIHPVCVFLAHGSAGASRRPAFPAPLSRWGRDEKQTSGVSAARTRWCVCCLKS